MTDELPNNNAQKTLTRKQFYTVLIVATIWLVIVQNPSKFFIGLGVAPVDTLALLLGSLVVPLLPSYLIAKLIVRKIRYTLFQTWLVLAILILLMMTIGNLRIDEQIDNKTTQKDKATAYEPVPLSKSVKAMPEEMQGVKLGDSLSNIQFQHGKLKERKPVHLFERFESRGFKLYETETNVIIWEKNGKAEVLSYECPSNFFDNLNYFHFVRCNEGTKDIFSNYGETNVDIFCEERDVGTRLYEVKSKNIRFYLSKDRINYIAFSSSPFSKSKEFGKKC